MPPHIWTKPRGLKGPNSIDTAELPMMSQVIRACLFCKNDGHLARLLKTSILPEHMKTFTRKEYRNAPIPAAGSASEQYQDEDEMMVGR